MTSRYLSYLHLLEALIFIVCVYSAPPSLIWNSEGAIPLSLSDVSDDYKTTPMERRFEPYDFNGG